jgi:hypothetical protein
MSHYSELYVDGLKAEIDELSAALADVFALMDEGYLVRDISGDAEPGFAMRQLPYVERLTKARATLEKVTA